MNGRLHGDEWFQIVLYENSPRSDAGLGYFHNSVAVSLLWLWPENMVQPCWFL